MALSCCTGPCIYLLCYVAASRKLFRSSFRACLSFVRPSTIPAASGTVYTNKPFRRINTLDPLLRGGTPGGKLSGKMVDWTHSNTLTCGLGECRARYKPFQSEKVSYQRMNSCIIISSVGDLGLTLGSRFDLGGAGFGRGKDKSGFLNGRPLRLLLV